MLFPKDAHYRKESWMYGFALWDNQLDWFRKNPVTCRAVVLEDLEKLLTIRELLIQAGEDPERVMPVELLGREQALREIDLAQYGRQ
jgi:hypothetical protein